MKVYVLMEIDYDDCFIRKVFTNGELADTYMAYAELQGKYLDMTVCDITEDISKEIKELKTKKKPIPKKKTICCKYWYKHNADKIENPMEFCTIIRKKCKCSGKETSCNFPGNYKIWRNNEL